MDKNDTLLVKEILAGNRQAERALYERHEQYWFRLCLRYGKNRMEAQDILQEGLIGVFRDLPQFDPSRGAFRGWSNRVVVNAALRFLKKNQWQQSFVDLDEVGEEADLSEDILGQINAKELVQLIQKLPVGYRLVFNMYVIEGFNHREIAEKLNIAVGTSKSQLAKAKRKLREELEDLFRVR